MTRFRSSFLLLAGLAASGCVAPSGVAVPAIASADIAAAYIPLHRRIHLGIDSANGAAMVLAPGIAVTVGHNANLVDPQDVIGRARDYDLMFFRIGRQVRVATASVQTGTAVTAYGQGEDAGLRMAQGTVRSLQPCPGCLAPAYFIFSGNAGPGFSGGPVLDGQGRLVGITFGYRDTGSERLIYAYDMMRVREELKAIAGTLPPGLD